MDIEADLELVINGLAVQLLIISFSINTLLCLFTAPCF